MPSVEQIDECLPQTQCTKCSYPGCFEYAQAIHQGQADINQCPPGGNITINALANLLDISTKPLNNEFGDHQPKEIVRVIEKDCIGCMLCIKACPVDAIIGANKLMHSVIESQCTGCELCLPVCPMDCIEMLPTTSKPDQEPWPDYSLESVKTARQRRQNRVERLAKEKRSKKQSKNQNSQTRQQLIQDVLERTRNKT